MDSSRITEEAARLRREHGYSAEEALWMARLTEIFMKAGGLFVAADDLPDGCFRSES